MCSSPLFVVIHALFIRQKVCWWCPCSRLHYMIHQLSWPAFGMLRKTFCVCMVRIAGRSASSNFGELAGNQQVFRILNKFRWSSSFDEKSAMTASCVTVLFGES